jgi:hypothetical protein
MGLLGLNVYYWCLLPEWGGVGYEKTEQVVMISQQIMEQCWRGERDSNSLPLNPSF